ncbi:cobalt ECF transporter T component CbiQ [Cohnella lupini]|uniref:Cobalt ECF transporter T component CbiQ n=1 Tax=Cohnella lupini TaxID=1294267 RepID=A0A3D9HU95_9BACL|nr:cobalt ECF transporter T component CbiQ [Cohnella lupini]RED53047.1 cobalt ECF transporter T component CbiQ [Cohnella lupini]
MAKAIITLHETEGVSPLIAKPSHRLWTVLILLALTVILWQTSVLAVSAGIFLLLLLWCGIPIQLILGRMLLLLPFGAGAAIFIPFHTEGIKAFELFGFAATEEGLERAIVILLKLVNANLLLTYLLAVTPLFVLLRSLRSVGVPAVLLELILLMMRYFFLLREEAVSMFKAQRSRGMNFKGWLWSSRAYKRFGELMGVLFLRAYERSKRIYIAMSARGGLEGDTKMASKTDGEATVTVDARNAGGTSAEDYAGDAGAFPEFAAEVKNVTFSYGKIKALNGVSFNIPIGSKVALMGPNGAGKSTLISLLNGLELSQAGEVRLFGEVVRRDNGDRLRRRVGVVYQDPDDQIFSTSVEEDVAFGPRNLGLSADEVEERVDTALASVGMRDMKRRSPFELSYGQKRRVAIAGVLAMKPDFIILDEPMSFLDPKGRDELQALLDGMRQTGMTILIATHDVDFAAEWADHVLLLKDGKLLASGTAELLFEDDLIEEASLHLPRLARPFRLLRGAEEHRPRSVKQAAQMIWRLIVKGNDSTAAPKPDGLAEDRETKQRLAGVYKQPPY